MPDTPASSSDEADHPGSTVPAPTDLGTAELTVDNIGGIDHCTVDFTPGVTILTGPNATNRTSFLSALNGVLGGTAATLKTDADTGSVALTLTANGDSYEYKREYIRKSPDTVTNTGRPFTSDSEIVDTFATLLETNDARKAVQQGSNVRAVLMRPVDTDAVQRELREKTRERDELQSELDSLDSLIDREATLTEQREQTKSELEDIRNDISELESVVEDYEADMDMAAEAEALVDDLETKRSEVRDLENEVEILQAELDALRDEETELREQAVELYRHGNSSNGDTVDINFVNGDTEDSIPWDDVTDDNQIRELEDDVTRLRTLKNELSATIDDLTRITSFNKSTIEDASDIPGITSGNGDVTAGLAPETKQINCWTCGTTVDRQAIKDRTSELESFIAEKQDDLDDVEDELESAQTELSNLRETRQEREKLQSELDSVQSEQDRVEDSLEATKHDLETAREELQELQEAVTETEELRESDLLDVYEKLNSLEYERGQKENKLDDIIDELSEITDARERRDDIETQLDELRNDIEALRTRIADLERDVVDSFNNHMETILDRLAYENIARVWIERRVPESSTGIQTGEFELHVIRKTDDGSVYEDRVENLSESEREVIGLVVALTGYIVHDVQNTVPFILLDSVEAVDADRLVTLVDYLSTHTTYLTVALLPEDAAVFSDDHERVTADALSISP